MQEKTVIPVIGKYDRYSNYAEKNIARVFNYKKKIYTIPYNTQFFDACNDGTLAKFMLENSKTTPLDRNGFFINETSKLVDAILNNLESKLIGR